MSHSILKMSLIDIFTILPAIGTEPIESIILVFSFIRISIGKLLLSAAVLQRVYKKAIIDRSGGFELAFSMHYSKFPMPMIDYIIDFIHIEPFLMP